MSVAASLDILPSSATRELLRFIRDHDVPIYLRELTSAAFCVGYGLGAEQVATFLAGDARALREQFESLRQRVEAMEA